MLIFKNGKMTWLQAGEQVLVDADGNAVPVAHADNKQVVECYIDVLTEDRKGKYPDGKYVRCEYSILLDQLSVPSNFNPKSVTLTHNSKGFIGQFSVQRIEWYDLTGSIEIWV